MLRTLDTRSEAGQATVFGVLILLVLIGMASLIVDGGSWLTTRRNLQGVADAAALAGVRELPNSQTQANSRAVEYATTQNAADDATVQTVNVTPTTVEVTVNRAVTGAFSSVLGKDGTTVRARARAEVAQVMSMNRMLPFAFMRDSFTFGNNTEIKWDDPVGSGNRGAVGPPGGPNCQEFQGAADIEKLILTAEYGGADACAVDLLDTIPTETGNFTGKVESGFGTRIGSNSQSMDDVFEFDPVTGRYNVIDWSSPRLGIIPIIENTSGTTTWPTGKKDVRVVGYTLVYIGHLTQPGHPAYYPDGKSVWVTPLDTVLPDELQAGLGAYDPNTIAPIAFRLVE